LKELVSVEMAIIDVCCMHSSGATVSCRRPSAARPSAGDHRRLLHAQQRRDRLLPPPVSRAPYKLLKKRT